MAKLTTVTITGADDGVDPAALIELSQEFPFVEWAILMSVKRHGTPRYPSAEWITRFERTIYRHEDEDDDRDGAIRLAAHFCGEMARDTLAGSMEWCDCLPLRYRRVQLNGFSDYVLPGLIIDDRQPHEFILQCNDAVALGRAADLGKRYSNVTALQDPSGGRGIQAEWWPFTPDIRCGFAGGIGPDNIDIVVAALGERTSGAFWIDMESAVRTDDRFDVAKVRRVLELAAPFVEKE